MTIEFWLDGTPTAAPPPVTFMPYGTRSIRLRVRTQRPLPALIIRPHTLSTEKAKGVFRGFEDGVSTAEEAHFEIFWGGGQEDGPCAKSQDRLGAFESCVELAPGDERTIIFALTHLSAAIPAQATVTFNAYHDDTIVASLPLTIVPPQPFPADIQRFVQQERGRWTVTSGRYLPRYSSRWWPEASVTYEAGTAVPPLTVIHDRGRNQLHVLWQDNLVARIEDHTNPTVLDSDYVRVELYHFDEYYYALRLWFVWLDVNIGHGYFIGQHEVPDAERFDLLIRKQDGKVGLACTDLHWRESWGVATETPMLATIGLTRATKIRLARDQIGELWSRVWGQAPQEDDRVYNPLEFVRRRASREARYDNFVVRGKGTEAHLPMLQNVEAEERMTSSDVRRG